MHSDPNAGQYGLSAARFGGVPQKKAADQDSNAGDDAATGKHNAEEVIESPTPQAVGDGREDELVEEVLSS